MREFEIKFDAALQQAAPALQVIVVQADVENCPTSDALWTEIEVEAARIAATYAMADIRHRPAIDATRVAYKALGKEPNRYRPSAEALCRRAVGGGGLYRTLTCIDLINLLSMATGVSIGGFDEDHIEGDTLTLGVGRAGEPYAAIGRGELNIEHLPVFRDAAGGIGTPTSDNERTKLSPSTRHLLMTINLYGRGEHTPQQVLEMTEDLLARHAGVSNVRSRLWPCTINQ